MGAAASEDNWPATEEGHEDQMAAFDREIAMLDAQIKVRQEMPGHPERVK